MFKKYLSLMPSASPSSTPTSPAKTSSKESPENGQVPSSGHIQINKHEKKAIVDSNQDGSTPGLILPTCPVSTVVIRPHGKEGESYSSDNINRGNIRDDDSLLTTESQSMDLSSFIKSLELQKNQKLHPDQGHKSNDLETPQQPDSLHTDSLSLRASKLDLSLVINTKDIPVDSDKSKPNDENPSNSNKSYISTSKSNEDTDGMIFKKSSNALKAHQLSSISPTTNDSSHAPRTIAGIGEQLYRESLIVKRENSTKRESEDKHMRDVSKNARSKGNRDKFVAFVIVCVLIAFGSDRISRPKHDASTVEVSTGFDLMSGESQAPETKQQVQESNDCHSQNHIIEKIPINGKKDSDNNFPRWHDTSPKNLQKDQTNSDDKKIYDPSKSTAVGSYDWMQFIMTNRKVIVNFCVWPVALLLLAFRLLFFFRSQGNPKVEATMVIPEQSANPTTPTGMSSRRHEDRFLTPPLPCKKRAREPSEWTSPCYGEHAIDVSVYKAMKAADLRELLRTRKCNNQGSKEQMIKMLIQSYQNELACLTVQQLRPKLRRLKLSQKGTKKDVVRRLVEAGPI